MLEAGFEQASPKPANGWGELAPCCLAELRLRHVSCHVGEVSLARVRPTLCVSSTGRLTHVQPVGPIVDHALALGREVRQVALARQLMSAHAKAGLTASTLGAMMAFGMAGFLLLLLGDWQMAVVRAGLGLLYARPQCAVPAGVIDGLGRNRGQHPGTFPIHYAVPPL